MIATIIPAYETAHRGPAECVSIREVPEPVPEWMCREHIERILSSVTFGRAGQLRLLLKWLAERSLAVDARAPSEKEIAAEVLNRKEFDPQTDSLVRKEMSRLREKLARYYISEGLRDEILIGSGSGYRLAFGRRANADAGGGKPCWLVLPFRSSAALLEESEQLLDELMMGLAERGGLDLVAPTTALAYRGRTGDVRQFAAECRSDFVLEGSLRRENESIEVAAWLVDGQNSRARRFKRITGCNAGDLARQAVAWLVDEELTRQETFLDGVRQ